MPSIRRYTAIFANAVKYFLRRQAQAGQKQMAGLSRAVSYAQRCCVKRDVVGRRYPA